jgi:hypothetical protein
MPSLDVVTVTDDVPEATKYTEDHLEVSLCVYFRNMRSGVYFFFIHKSVHRKIITNYSQKYANFLEFIYFYRRSTCFRLFLGPSSGAHNCTYSFRHCQTILLLAATVEEIELFHRSS